MELSQIDMHVQFAMVLNIVTQPFQGHIVEIFYIFAYL